MRRKRYNASAIAKRGEDITVHKATLGTMEPTLHTACTYLVFATLPRVHRRQVLCYLAP